MRLRGSIPRETKWDIVVDLFFYREPEDAEKEEQAAKEMVPIKSEPIPPEVHPPQDDYIATELQPWTEQEPVVPATTGTTPYNANEDWANEVQGEWNNVTTAAAATAGAPPPATTNWGVNSEWN